MNDLKIKKHTWRWHANRAVTRTATMTDINLLYHDALYHFEQAQWYRQRHNKSLACYHHRLGIKAYKLAMQKEGLISEQAD